MKVDGPWWYAEDSFKINIEKVFIKTNITENAIVVNGLPILCICESCLYKNGGGN